MASIFTINNIDNFSEKINIDELYERKQKGDAIQLEIYNKMLNRVHIRIRTASRQRVADTVCWYIVPEVIIGVPNYDHAACIAYLIDKLKINGFAVRYTHPNMLLISWGHYVPSYVRDEIKKKTGIQFNEYGERLNLLALEEDKIGKNDEKRNTKMQNMPKEIFTPMDTYKPSGKLIYNTSDFQNRVVTK